MTQAPRVLDQDLISKLVARPRGADPVISLYLLAWGPSAERKAVLKNAVREADAAIEEDGGWSDEQKKLARRLLEQARARGEQLVQHSPPLGRGSHALFAFPEALEELRLPVDTRERLVVDRSAFASPLTSLVDQYERYAVVLCDKKRAKLFSVYLAQFEDQEELEDEYERRIAPAGGPVRRGGGITTGGFHGGLEEVRRRNHAEYVLHQHLQHVAERAFTRFRLKPYDRLILGAPKDLLPKLEDQLHSYLKPRIVAREQIPLDLGPKELLSRVLAIEAAVEERKERELLKQVESQLGDEGLATTGADDTLRALFFGQVRTLMVRDDDPQAGWQCGQCKMIFPRLKGEEAMSPKAVECPAIEVCPKKTSPIPSLIDEAVDLAILSGARVEHIAYAKDALAKLGGMAALLRFK